MKGKFKSVGDWFKEKFKSKKKHTIEGIYEFVAQEFNYDRMNLERANAKVEKSLEDSKRDRDYIAELLERESTAIKQLNGEIKKNAKLEKDNLILKAEIKLLKKEAEDFKSSHWLVKEVPEDKATGKQTIKVKSGASNSRIIKKVKEGK